MTLLSRHGGRILSDQLQWEISGPVDAPVIVVLGGISADEHVVGTRANGAAGWWEDVIGHPSIAGTYRVLGVRYVEVEGAPTSTGDQALAVVTALDRLAIDSAHAIVGASYGGMVALALAARYPTRAGRLVVVCAAHESHPMATAGRVLQRRVVELGVATGRSREALALARGIAITSYRSAAEFATRFGGAATIDGARPRFPVEPYLEHHGERFTEAFEPARFIALSESIDLHRIDPACISVPVTLVAVTTDTLVPAWQLRALQDRLARSRYFEIDSVYGHDGFLKEAALLTPIILAALHGDHDD